MKHEIEIPDLPEGWEAVAYRVPLDVDEVLICGEITKGKFVNKSYEHLIVRKKQPRRIVLEETCKEDRKAFLHAGKHWKIVEDNK